MIDKPALCSYLLAGAAMVVTGCSALENMHKCQSVDPDTRIAGCTALIEANGGRNENLDQVYNNRGLAYSRKGDHARAIEDFNEAIRLSPNHANFYRNRGADYYKERDFDHAIQDSNEAIRLSPNYAIDYYERGNAYAGRGRAYDNESDYGRAIQDYNRAIQDYTEAIRLNRNYGYAYYGRGLAYDSRGVEHESNDDYARAIQDYSEAIRLNPKTTRVYLYRGLAYDHNGNYERAVQDLNEAIQLDPKDATAYLGRGVTHIHMGNYDQAILDLNEAIRLNPNDAVAYGTRGEIYLLRANLTAAITDLEKAISVAPSSRTGVGSALMLHVAMRREGRDDVRELTQVAAVADLSKWPAPVLKLYLGKMTTSEVMAIAADSADDRRKWHVCQANYLIGEEALLHNQRAAALVRFKAARDGCPKWDLDFVEALAELKRLGVPATAAK